MLHTPPTGESVREDRTVGNHETAPALLDWAARSAHARIAAGTSISTPVLVATVRAEIPASRKSPAR